MFLPIIVFEYLYKHKTLFIYRIRRTDNIMLQMSYISDSVPSLPKEHILKRYL